MKSRYLKNRLSPLASRLSSGTPRIKRIPSSLLSIAAIAGLGLALAPAAQAATILDDFSTDTSANYYNYKYDTAAEYSPVKFDIDDSDNNILQLDSTSANGLVHKTATLDIGETYKIDFLDAANIRGQIITTSATPGGTANYFLARIRWTDANAFGGFDFGGDVTGTDDIGPTLTLASGGSAYIERASTTLFNLYYDTGTSTRVKYGDFTLDTAYTGDIYVGVQTHNVLAPFDNLEITAIPEPSTFALTALGLLGLVGTRRRRSKS